MSWRFGIVFYRCCFCLCVCGCYDWNRTPTILSFEMIFMQSLTMLVHHIFFSFSPRNSLWLPLISRWFYVVICCCCCCWSCSSCFRLVCLSCTRRYQFGYRFVSNANILTGKVNLLCVCFFLPQPLWCIHTIKNNKER